jgi:uncharacterized protein (TIGR00730 family)
MSLRRKLTRLTVFGGTRPGIIPKYGEAAATLGALIASRGITLIFGGGESGVMGAIADAALAGGGRVIGVVPEFIRHVEHVHAKVTKMIVRPDMCARQDFMFRRADAFCVLPGGFGTLDEFFAVVTARQLRLHDKPIVVLNTDGYWDQLIAAVQGIAKRGFIHAEKDDLLTVVQRPEDVIGSIESEFASRRGPLRRI